MARRNGLKLIKNGAVIRHHGAVFLFAGQIRRAFYAYANALRSNACAC
jgi:hypothetical protein